MEIRARVAADLPGCVAALRAVHTADGYPTWWPADPAGWLSPAGTAAGMAVDDEEAWSVSTSARALGECAPAPTS